jgi:hypothetical protein
MWRSRLRPTLHQGCRAAGLSRLLIDALHADFAGHDAAFCPMHVHARLPLCWQASGCICDSQFSRCVMALCVINARLSDCRRPMALSVAADGMLRNIDRKID